MDSTRLARLIERYEIHTAACRYRKQGLCCSTCSDYADAAARACRALATAIDAQNAEAA
jgi:hypothetical protein